MFKQSLACLCIVLTLNILAVSSSAYTPATKHASKYGQSTKSKQWWDRMKWAGTAFAGAAVVAGVVTATVLGVQQSNQIRESTNQIHELNKQLSNSTPLSPQEIAFREAQAQQQQQQQAFAQSQAQYQQQQQAYQQAQADYEQAQQQKRAYYEQQMAALQQQQQQGY